MEQLFQSFSTEQLALFIVVVASLIIFVIKNAPSFWEKLVSFSKLIVKSNNMDKRIKNIENVNETQQKTIELLVESDRIRIKGEILKQCQYFERKGSIDKYSLEYLYRLYEIYKKEGGNSYVELLMKKVGKLDLDDTFAIEDDKDE